MNVRTCISEIQDVANYVHAKFYILRTKQINSKLSAETWSIGQNIEHLTLFNESIAYQLSTAGSKNYKIPWYARFRWLSNYHGKTILQLVHRNSVIKSKSPLQWLPTLSDVDMNIFDEYLISLNSIVEKLNSLAKTPEKTIKVKWPADDTTYIYLENLTQIIIEHQWRHIKKCDELLYFVKHHDFNKIQ